MPDSPYMSLTLEGELPPLTLSTSTCEGAQGAQGLLRIGGGGMEHYWVSEGHLWWLE